MDKRISEQYIAMVLNKVWNQNSENIQLEAVINRALADKISTETINTKVNSKLNAISVEIRNINPKYGEGSKNYADTKADILDALTNYESALMELSNFYDEKIEQLILKKVELETQKLGFLIRDEVLIQKTEKKEEEKQKLSSGVIKGVKGLSEKISYKNNNKEKEYIDVSLYNKVQDVQDVKVEVNNKMENRVKNAKEAFSQNNKKIQDIDLQIKKIENEINKLNDKKAQSLMQAMEMGDKWIAVNIKRPKMFTKVKRFFMSKFNTTKQIHKNIIVPLNDLVKEFRETELASVKG